MASTLKNNPISIVLIMAPLFQLMVFTFGVYSGYDAALFVIPMVLLCIIALGLIYYFIKKQDLKPDWEKIFLYVSVTCAVCVLCLNPPMMVPDEYAHFYRAYSIADGNIWAEAAVNGIMGNYMPSNITPDPGVWGQQTVELSTFRRLFFSVFSQNEEWISQNNTLVYFPLVYLPQALGVFLSKSIRMSIYWVLFFGRLFSFLAYFGMCYLAIKIIKERYKPIMLFVSLFPMAFYEGCSFATDSMVISSCYLMIASALRSDAYFKSKKANLLMYFAGFCAAMGKFTYWPLIFLPWINHVQRKYNKKGLISFNILATLCMIAWNLFVVINIKGIAPDSAVVPTEQLKYILSHIFSYAAMLLADMIKKVPTLYAQMFDIGWFDHVMYGLLFASPLAVLFFCFVKTEDDPLFSTKKTGKILFILLVILAVYALIETALYLTWTPVGENVIMGVQGRYLIEVLPLIMIFVKEVFCKFTIYFKRGNERKTALIATLPLMYLVVYLGITYWIKFIIM